MKMTSKSVQGRLSLLKNRYFVTGVFALVWVTFISEIDLIYLFKSKRTLGQLRNQVEHYEREITATTAQLKALSSDPSRLERFAREQYFMKKNNEDLFRVIDKSHVQKSK